MGKRKGNSRRKEKGQNKGRKIRNREIKER
jgi:hypothetical protein